MVLATAGLFGAESALAQHSPRLTETPELGGELVLGDDLTSLAAVLQARVGRQTDVRGGVGVADPDDSDSDAFVRGGVRAFVSPRSRKFPFDVAVEGELDVFFGQDNTIGLSGGPTFGTVSGPRGLLVPYVQPLFIYAHEVGQSDVRLGVRLGADYMKSPTTDLRADLVISSQMQLRAAFYVRPGRFLGRR